MAISEYREFVLVADADCRQSEVEKDEQGVHGFTVQVFSSPAGEGEPQSRPVPSDLKRYLGRLERRKLDVDGIIGLGEALADLLLPDQARELFIRSLDRLEPGQGLRLRLRLAPALASIPWEYMYVQRGAGEKDSTGFLALDPRISIVRHEALPVSGDFYEAPRPRRLLVALASPEGDGYQPLDLAQERANMEEALRGVPGIQLDFVEPATVQRVSDALLAGADVCGADVCGADVFHFAGHGVFQSTGLGTSIGSIVGEGAVVLVDEAGGPALVPADQIAVNLRGHGVQLVVLGACQTGRRDEENVWSGVVAALMEAGIPAAVAMQFKIWDDAAIAFGKSFYQALVAGLPLDQAVSAGRLAVFNLCHPLRDDPERGLFWREWGVPVLYLRSGQDFVLPAIADADERRAVAEGPTTVVRHRFGAIGPRGRYVAVEAGVVKGGRIESYLKVGRLRGRVTQVDAEQVTGGEISAEGEADVVEGEWTGVRLGSIGGPPQQPVAAGLTCPDCDEPVEASARFCPNCGAELPAGPKFCAQCGAKLTPGAKFCPQCGASVA
jgi:RNA polymerase subunit RPABC4/transcription elongation factor Spt4